VFGLLAQSTVLHPLLPAIGQLSLSDHIESATMFQTENRGLPGPGVQDVVPKLQASDGECSDEFGDMATHH